MNPGRFYMPGYIGMRGIPMSNSTLWSANSVPKGIGLFSKITSGIRSVNWSGLLTNANKTLNVVNQAIPLVRQAGPMVNNMKSMLRVARAFGTETTTTNYKKLYNNYNNVLNNNFDSNTINDNNINNISNKKKEEQNNSVPNFFV